ncbi:MAG: PAS domain S-box protein [Tissierellales bacterium]|nr:PAS domain S-box protein [Tissierellales bacterium]MBN2827490.1 PAS domain S-box protein [Tissierellales bacterium]
MESKKFYKEMLNEAGLAYAYHKIVLNEHGKPIDYVFLDINSHFERITGLESNRLIGHSVKESLPMIDEDSFDWIDFYGKIALNGNSKEFEQYSLPLNKYFHIKTFSPEKYFFITIVADITKQVEISRISNSFLEHSGETADYQIICDNMLMLSNARYCIFNLFDADGKEFTTVALSGVDDYIKKTSEYLGFNVLGKKWNHDKNRMNKIKNKTITVFDKLHQLTGNVISEKIILSLESIFNIGQVAIVKITKDEKMLGDFTLLMNKDEPLVMEVIIEIFATQIGLFLEKLNTQNLLKKAENKYQDLTEEAPIGVVTCDSLGNVTYANSHILKMHSVTKAKFLNINLFNTSILVEQGIPSHIMKVMQLDEVVTCEAIYPSKINPKKWFRIHINPLKELEQTVGARIIIDDITDFQLTQLKLLASKQNFNAFFEAIDDMIFVTDLQGNILYTNNSAQHKLNYSDSEFYSMNILELHPESLRIEALTIFEAMLKKQEDLCPLPLYSKSGATIPVETRVWLGEWNEKPCVFGISKDISKEQEALQKFNRLFENNPACMAVTSSNGSVFTEVNQSFINLTGFSKNEIIGKTVEELRLFPEYEKQKNIAEELKRNGHINNVELKIKTKDNQLLDGLFSGEIIESQGLKYGLTVMLDITDLKKSQEKIEFLSYHDQLTGVYNRRYFELSLIQFDNEQHLPLSVVMLDVNGLKLVNDAFGHLVGDELLKKITSVITRLCREKDIISRVGGDEFVLLLPNTDEAQTATLVESIKNSINEQKIKSISPSVSFGWETKHTPNQSLIAVFRRAEEYMYKHKIFESNSMRYQSIKMIMKTLYEKSPREENHSKRVSQLSYQIGLAMNLSAEKTNELLIAGLMHDIGKIVIDSNTLNKASSLSEEEWAEMKRHPEIGYQILRSVDEYASFAFIVLAHHERWDGKGYPLGLKGNEIALESRIIAIADTYDAMTHDRPYRKALTTGEALDEIRRNSGTQFDPQIVEVFLSI